MKDITIIIPVHKINDEINVFLKQCLNNIKKNQENYNKGKLIPMIVAPNDVIEKIEDIENYTICKNTSEKTDFCSQVNFAVQNVKTDYFSIMEYDDLYNEKWFKMADDYFFSNESVSVFLPINVLTNDERNFYQFCNEIAWTSSFSNEIGYLDFDCLQDYTVFNLTGGIFNTNDFKSVGGLKPSIKVAFNYEFLLRLTKKELKVFVVPKEGYTHIIGRKDSLTEEYNQTLTTEEIQKWFNLAKSEYAFTEDRKTNIDKIHEEELT